MAQNRNGVGAYTLKWAGGYTQVDVVNELKGT